jgi:TPR repeat protein
MLRSTFASLAFVLLATGGAVSAPTAADILAAMKQGNYALALRLARPLAEAGNAEAQAMVGNLYELGLGVAQDHSKALGWFTRAADQGNVTAETALGRMYSKGAGVQSWFALAGSGLLRHATVRGLSQRLVEPPVVLVRGLGGR